ncbi:MAG: tRNA (uridine(54)-C5)-methyltransferase TrmA [Gammaproteobacteria bacterium]|nr:MAG: tRNA (uridine(54)-C5)-methyltransferase TrmA [Gammaproteobacteria bacterium]
MPLSHFQPTQYAAQLAGKQARLLEALRPYGIGQLATFASAPSHYRMRAEFRIWHEGDRCDYVMYKADTPRQPVPIHTFPIACERIEQLMPPLLAQVNGKATLRKKLYQVEFLATTTGDCLLTMVYHKALDEDWTTEATALAKALGIHIIGRSRGKKHIIGQDVVTESFDIDGTPWTWQQPEGAFTQPNAGMNRNMLSWACQQVAPIGGDWLELYCGIGNFTLPLSAVCTRVLATEVNKTATRAALHNIAANQRDNITIARLSSEEMTSALNGDRPFRRLQGIDLPGYDFQGLLVDPPRAGLDDATRELARRFPNILYISCNPDTLFRDVAALADTHTVIQAALFDQFPYTHHMECGLLLQRKAP